MPLGKVAHKLNHIPYWVFLALFLVSAVITLGALRHNNQEMIQLRNAVYASDKSGSGVEDALSSLRAFVYGHMNTDLSSGGNAIKPPIQLKYTYQRLLDAEKSRVESSNASVYTDAQNYCQALNPVAFSGRTRVPCVTDYVTTHSSAVKTVPSALYQFDFISPAWSPDLAGFSLLISIVLFLALVFKLFLDKLVQSTL